MLTIKDLHKYYKSKKGQNHHALKGINLEFGSKGFIVLLGKSGSGKSTLLNILGGLDNFDSGEIIIKGKSTKNFKSNEWDSFRNTYVGFVFQEFYIIEEFNVGKNIALSLELQGYPKDEIDERVDEILRQVDLEGYALRKPNEISGGQKQRIAIARALVKNPQIILADEPTGNLDSETGKLVLETLKKLSKEKLVIMVTHDEEFARMYGDRIIELKDGEIIDDNLNYNQKSEEEIYNVNGPVKSVIKLPKGKQLTKNIISYLNNILVSGKSDLYISVTDDKDYIKSIVAINEKESAIDKIDLEKQLKDDSNDKFALKKTSLPLKNAVKLAFSSLLTKKIKLIFMTFLFVCSLVFVGIASNFSFYDVGTASNLTFKKGNINYIPITKFEEVCPGDYCYDVVSSFNYEEIDFLKNKYSSIDFTPVFNKIVNISDILMQSQNKTNIYYSENFNRMTIIDANENLFKLIAGSYPVAITDILITDYMAEMLTTYDKYSEIDNIDDLIDEKLSYNGFDLIIKGIVDTDYEKYSDLKDIDDHDQFGRSGFYQDRDTIYQQMYIQKETYEKIFNLFVDINLFVNDNFYYYPIGKPSDIYNDYLIGDSHLPQNDDEIVITISSLSDFYDKEIESIDNFEEYYQYIGNTISIGFESTKGEYEIKTKEYKVVGIIDDINNNVKPKVVLSEKEYNEYNDKRMAAAVVLGSNNSENANLINDLNKLNYRHETKYSGMLFALDEITQGSRKILFIVGGVFALFTSFMIFTFISSSIANKRKEIGTLRAIGARGIDVSKIFIIEGLIIAIVSSLSANILTVVVINLVNNSITAEFNISLVLLYVNIISILIVLLLSIVVVVLATFIPLKRITLMKPIKAIKKTI